MKTGRRRDVEDLDVAVVPIDLDRVRIDQIGIGEGEFQRHDAVLVDGERRLNLQIGRRGVGRGCDGGVGASSPLARSAWRRRAFRARARRRCVEHASRLQSAGRQRTSSRASEWDGAEQVGQSATGVPRRRTPTAMLRSLAPERARERRRGGFGIAWCQAQGGKERWPQSPLRNRASLDYSINLTRLSNNLRD